MLGPKLLILISRNHWRCVSCRVVKKHSESIDNHLKTDHIDFLRSFSPLTSFSSVDSCCYDGGYSDSELETSSKLHSSVSNFPTRDCIENVSASEGLVTVKNKEAPERRARLSRKTCSYYDDPDTDEDNIFPTETEKRPRKVARKASQPTKHIKPGIKATVQPEGLYQSSWGTGPASGLGRPIKTEVDSSDDGLTEDFAVVFPQPVGVAGEHSSTPERLKRKQPSSSKFISKQTTKKRGRPPTKKSASKRDAKTSIATTTSAKTKPSKKRGRPPKEQLPGGRSSKELLEGCGNEESLPPHSSSNSTSETGETADAEYNPPKPKKKKSQKRPYKDGSGRIRNVIIERTEEISEAKQKGVVKYYVTEAKVNSMDVLLQAKNQVGKTRLSSNEAKSLTMVTSASGDHLNSSTNNDSNEGSSADLDRKSPRVELSDPTHGPYNASVDLNNPSVHTISSTWGRSSGVAESSVQQQQHMFTSALQLEGDSSQAQTVSVTHLPDAGVSSQSVNTHSEQSLERPSASDWMKHTMKFAFDATQRPSLALECIPRVFECPLCPRKFSSQENLTAHFSKMSLKMSPSQCKACKRMFHNVQDLNLHIFTVHERKKYPFCFDCGEKFQAMEAFEVHLFRHMHAREPSLLEREYHTCSVCQVDLPYIYNSLHGHYYKMHKMTPCLECFVCSQLVIPPDRYALKDHKERHLEFCEVCLKDFSSMEAFKAHLDNHPPPHFPEDGWGTACKQCNKWCPNRPAKELHLKHHRIQHQRDWREKKWSVGLHCLFCDRVLRNERNLQRHVEQLHASNKTFHFQCEFCGKGVNTRNALRDHIANVHIGVKRYSCRFCSESFGSGPTLRRHVLRNHDTDKQYPCPHCEKRFVDKAMLKRHLPLHTGTGRFMCEECGKGFQSPSEFRKHKTSHTDKREHYCTGCGTGYKRSEHLRRHERRCSKFKLTVQGPLTIAS